MYIKHGAWKEFAKFTIQMNLLTIEWGIFTLIDNASRKMNRIVSDQMYSTCYDLEWSHFGVGLTRDGLECYKKAHKKEP